MVAKVRGRFDEFTGSFTLDGANPSASSASLTIMAASIDTKNADRDGHLTSPEFLRKEFGMVWNVALETGGVLVGDTVKLEFDVEAVRQA
jgi:Uncharacterized conserved protein